MTIDTPADNTSLLEQAPAQNTQPWGYALLLRLHFYIGLLVGPFIFVAAFTGALFAFTPQIENWLYHSALTTEARGTPHPLAEQIDTARQAVTSSATLAAVRPAPGAGQTTRVMFAEAGLGPSEHRAIFIDPATLTVTGDMTVYGTSGTLPFRIWIDYLHRNLHLGDLGRYYSELAASWLWLIAVGGLVLWWNRRRRLSARSTHSSPPGRRLRNWHGSLGVVLLISFLFFSVTGLTWSKWAGSNIASLRASLDWGTPKLVTTLSPQLPATGHDAHHHHGPEGQVSAINTHDLTSFDRVLSAARSAGIDASRLEIRPGKDNGSAWVVREIDRRWPTQVDAVAVDPHTLKVTDQLVFSDFPLAAKLTRWGIDAHMGILFGLLNQLLVAFCALGLCVIIVLGYRMWWQRRPTRNLTPHPPRLWRHLKKAPSSALLGMAAVAVLLGWFAPVMGFSLLGFLVVDGVLMVAKSNS